MVKITKLQRDYLESNGCKFPDDIYKTLGRSKHCTYYATESSKVMHLLDKYRKEHIVQSYR